MSTKVDLIKLSEEFEKQLLVKLNEPNAEPIGTEWEAEELSEWLIHASMPDEKVSVRLHVPGLPAACEEFCYFKMNTDAGGTVIEIYAGDNEGAWLPRRERNSQEEG